MIHLDTLGLLCIILFIPCKENIKNTSCHVLSASNHRPYSSWSRIMDLPVKYITTSKFTFLSEKHVFSIIVRSLSPQRNAVRSPLVKWKSSCEISCGFAVREDGTFNEPCNLFLFYEFQKTADRGRTFPQITIRMSQNDSKLNQSIDDMSTTPAFCIFCLSSWLPLLLLLRSIFDSDR